MSFRPGDRVTITKCGICGAPAVTSTRPLLGSVVALCAAHANRKA